LRWKEPVAKALGLDAGTIGALQEIRCRGSRFPLAGSGCGEDAPKHIHTHAIGLPLQQSGAGPNLDVV
jgi:hypothetical protein